MVLFSVCFDLIQTSEFFGGGEEVGGRVHCNCLGCMTNVRS